MRYVKQLNWKKRPALYLLGAALLLSSCGGAPVKKTSKAGNVMLPLTGTMVYIPVQKMTKKGLHVPYQSMANPYLAQAGKINMDAVKGFIAARRAFKAKQFDKTVILLDAVVKNDSTLAGPWVMKGDVAVVQNKLEDAVKHYQQAIDVNKLNVNTYIKLAKALRMQGKYHEAQGVHANALGIWKDFPEAHLNLAVLYDVYLNNSVLAQRHMEAYQFLTESKDGVVAGWLQEIRSRTGAEPNLVLEKESSASHNSPSEGENIES